jgi:hypothetical protein
MPSDWLEIVKSVGVPFTFLGAVLWYVGKVMLPKLMAQHDADREAFLAGIKALTDQAAKEREAFMARPCYWQPPAIKPIAEAR